MDRPPLPFTFKGSIADAITEAQTKRRLFVVYISGDDDASTNLEQSTWMDQRVAESISKHCVFLHLVDGSVDALQFSAIYPQNFVPSITVIGFNGVIIWGHGGFINAENLVENVEKARATLQIQETAAALLTAALTSNKSSTSTPGLATSSEEGSSSSTDKDKCDEIVLSSKDVHASSPTESAEISSGGGQHEHTCQNSRITSEEGEIIAGESIKRAKSCSTGPQSKPKSVQDDSGCHSDSETLRNDSVCQSDSQSERKSDRIVKEVEESQDEKVETSAKTLSATRPSDVYLNIRMPTGTCLQMRFSLTDTLQSVKYYVNENAVSNMGAYDLAIPYPRKIFMEEDMSKTMSELGFASREALIVVPHQHAAIARQVQSASLDRNAANEADPSDIDSGYFALLKRILSYVNPFSYLRAYTHSPSSDHSQNGSQHQGTAPWNNPSELGEHYYPNASGERNLQRGNDANIATRRLPNRFGGNVHTLRDVEREPPSDDRNVFWNGNSTQFGGDDRK